jgi:hypothetical protein
MNRLGGSAAKGPCSPFSQKPKPMTSHSKAEGRFGKQDFRYLVVAYNMTRVMNIMGTKPLIAAMRP